MTQQAQAHTPDATPIIAIEQAGEYAGQTVTIRGWLYNIRESGKLLFPIFRDGTGVIQGVVSLKEQPQAFEALKGLTAGIERHCHRKNSSRTARARWI